jgi:hypothetical protein
MALPRSSDGVLKVVLCFQGRRFETSPNYPGQLPPFLELLVRGCVLQIDIQGRLVQNKNSKNKNPRELNGIERHFSGNPTLKV